jgi:hypothetical protein
MIPRIGKSGKSFAGLSAYLLSDPKAQTNARIAWTHTFNCAAADNQPALAVDEMYWTFRNAELLKEEAGIGAGGRPLERPVKHMSLSWHPSQKPDPAEMIATSEQFLRFMGYGEAQVLMVAHNDTPHAHVHLMVNRVNPNTGLVFDESHERLHASQWAKQYEIDQRLIFCQERFKEQQERAPSPTREQWQEMKEAEIVHFAEEARRRGYDPGYLNSEANNRALSGEEWNLLKSQHRAQREAFFENGKDAYREVRNTVFRETKEEFRGDWRNFFEACRDGASPEIVDAMKTDILERQRAAFSERKDGAMADLRETRDEAYAALLSSQRGEKAELRAAHAQGQHLYHLMDGEGGADIIVHRSPSLSFTRPASNDDRSDATDWQREAAAATVDQRDADDQGSRQAAEPWCSEQQNGPKTRDGFDAASSLTASVTLGLASVAEGLFDGFLGGGPPKPRDTEAPAPRAPGPEFLPENPFARFAADLKQASEKRAKEDYDQSYWDERERRRE